MTDPSTVNPSITIKSWRVVVAETTTSAWRASETPGGMAEMIQDMRTLTYETVTATFTISNAPVELLTGRGPRHHQVDSVRVKFVSTDGGGWDSDILYAFGIGVLKNGLPGAETEVRSFDFHPWLKELLDERYGRIGKDSYPWRWINMEYPRAGS